MGDMSTTPLVMGVESNFKIAIPEVGMSASAVPRGRQPASTAERFTR